MPQMYPIYKAKDSVERDCTPAQANWVLNRARIVVIFPNLLVNDITPTTSLRSYRPLSVDQTEVSIYCLGPVGESDELRSTRIRGFEDAFMPGGMVTADGIAVLESTHESCKALTNRWSDMTRGLSTLVHGPDDAAKELGITPEVSANDSFDEINLQAIYRHWSRLMGSAHEHSPG